jgi:molybdate transport system substrate-binding protein
MYAALCCGAHAGEIKLYAAASLTDALTELSAIYEKNYPDVVIKKSFAGSSTLAKQIENGAPADLFISADMDWVGYLQKRGLLDDPSLKKLLVNELVLIAPLESKVTLLLDPAFNLMVAYVPVTPPPYLWVSMRNKRCYTITGGIKLNRAL